MDFLDIIFGISVFGLAAMVFFQMRRADRAEAALARVETVIPNESVSALREPLA